MVEIYIFIFVRNCSEECYHIENDYSVVFHQIPPNENIQYPEYHEGTTSVLSVYIRM